MRRRRDVWGVSSDARLLVGGGFAAVRVDVREWVAAFDSVVAAALGMGGRGAGLVSGDVFVGEFISVIKSVGDNRGCGFARIRTIRVRALRGTVPAGRGDGCGIVVVEAEAQEGGGVWGVSRSEGADSAELRKFGRGSLRRYEDRSRI